MPRDGNGNRSMPKFAGGASLISGIQRGARKAPSHHAWTLGAKDAGGGRGKVLGRLATGSIESLPGEAGVSAQICFGEANVGG